MGAFQNVVCPISNSKVDSYTSRLTVFLNAVLLTAYLATGWPLFVLIVAVDYAIRAAWDPTYSPLRWIAAAILKGLGAGQKPVGSAPKLFASRIGMLFAVMSVLMIPISPAGSMIAAGILMFFAYLDSVFNFCVGCLTYHYIVRPLFKDPVVEEASDA